MPRILTIAGSSRCVGSGDCQFGLSRSCIDLVLCDAHRFGVCVPSTSLDGFPVQGSKKTLILREINEDSVASLLEKKDAMADCDVAAFVYDRYELSYFIIQIHD